MAVPLSKYLGWVKRFLYGQEGVAVAMPSLVNTLSIDHDWPLSREIKRIRVDGLTIAGTITSTYTCPPGKHAKIFELAYARLSAGVFPVTDTWQLQVSRQGESCPLGVWTNGFTPSWDYIPLVGGVAQLLHTAGAVPFMAHGGPPVYLGPGDSLTMAHASVAGGITTTFIGFVLERDQSYPLELP